MRTIEYANAFKKDYKRVKATPRHARDADPLLTAILERLVADSPLPPSNRVLRLARFGSHSELFG